MTGITQKLVELKSILHEYDMALCDADCNMDEIESRAHKILDMECLRDLLEHVEHLNESKLPKTDWSILNGFTPLSSISDLFYDKLRSEYNKVIGALRINGWEEVTTNAGIRRQLPRPHRDNYSGLFVI